jgi:hypothetical protein
MGKAKDLSAFERGMVGARRTGLSRTAPLLGFSHHLCIGDGPPPERHPTNLTVGSIGVNVGQHPCGMLSTPDFLNIMIRYKKTPHKDSEHEESFVLVQCIL